MSEVRVNNLSNENLSGGPTISGITTFSSPHFFVPPQGNTAERPQDCPPGSLRFNTDTAKLEYHRGETIGWQEVEAELTEPLGESGASGGLGYRGLVFGGYRLASPVSTQVDTIDYHNLSAAGTWLDFGDLFAGRYGTSATASRTRAVIMGGHSNDRNTIDFVTIASLGDSTNAADLPVDHRYAAAFGDGVRACVAGSYYPAQINNISYTDIATLGDAQDFGDLTVKRGIIKAANSSTRGVIGGGYEGPSPNLSMDYVTISTRGNAVDFADTLPSTGQSGGACESATRALWSGSYSNVIGYITIATLGDMVDFGDNFTSRGHRPACSSPTRGFWNGGRNSSSPYPSETDVDFVQIATTGRGKDFGDLSQARHAGGSTSNGHGGL